MPNVEELKNSFL